LATRTLSALAYSVFALGLAIGALGLVPAVDSAAVSRCGAWIAIASLPLWVSRAAKRATEANEQVIADAHLAGYQLAVQHFEDAAGGRVVIPRLPAAGGPGAAHAERHDRS
jgi:hypothetical protein